MKPLLKIVLPLAVVLPLGGFVAGSLADTDGDDPPPRTPIILREDRSGSPAEPTGDPSQRPSDRRTGQDDGDDGDDVPVITPRPVEDRDDADDADDRDDDGGGDSDDDGDDDGDD